MKKFHVFWYDEYDLNGGMGDYQGSFETLEEVREILKGCPYRDVAVETEDGGLRRLEENEIWVNPITPVKELCVTQEYTEPNPSKQCRNMASDSSFLFYCHLTKGHDGDCWSPTAGVFRKEPRTYS